MIKPTVQQIVSEVPRAAEGALAIAVVIVLPDGNLRTLWAHNNNGKFPMLAGLTILSNDICSKQRLMTEPPATRTHQ